MWAAWEGNSGGSVGTIHGDFGNWGALPIGLGGAEPPTLMGIEDVHRSLWTAVILRALQDARGKATTDAARRVKDEARGWFVAAGGDFHRVCRMAGLNPSWVRRQALKRLG